MYKRKEIMQSKSELVTKVYWSMVLELMNELCSRITLSYLANADYGLNEE